MCVDASLQTVWVDSSPFNKNGFNWDWGCGSVVKCLPNRQEALGFILVLQKKKKKKKSHIQEK
jgi:hypothetical protein